MSRRTILTCCSLQGQREENEDAVIIESVGPWSFCLVLDGMGGRGLGVQASRTVGTTISRWLRGRLLILGKLKMVPDCLRTAITEAHQNLEAINRRCRALGSVAFDRGMWVDPLFPMLGIPGQVPEIDYVSVVVEPGHFLAVCSDGVSVLTPEEIETALLGQDPEPPSERLCRLALARGTRDNVTAAVAQVVDETLAL